MVQTPSPEPREHKAEAVERRARGRAEGRGGRPALGRRSDGRARDGLSPVPFIKTTLPGAVERAGV